eukprot:788162-Pyramimonas_sp.AAC.1
MAKMRVADPTHYHKKRRLLASIDRTFVSFPGWTLIHFSIVGEVADFPEVLHKRGISDHAHVVASTSSSFPSRART